MNDELKKQIREIMSGMQCPLDFKCAESGFEKLCKARDFGLDSYLDCLEENPPCSFSLSFGDGHLCQCPLRVFIAKKLAKPNL